MPNLVKIAKINHYSSYKSFWLQYHLGNTNIIGYKPSHKQSLKQISNLNNAIAFTWVQSVGFVQASLLKSHLHESDFKSMSAYGISDFSLVFESEPINQNPFHNSEEKDIITLPDFKKYCSYVSNTMLADNGFEPIHGHKVLKPYILSEELAKFVLESLVHQKAQAFNSTK